jgi:hypothetical protein
VLDVQKTKHCTVEADRLTVFYRDAGMPDAPGLLLLHGFPSSSHSFRNVIRPLAEVARVVAPDMPGFGFTEAPDAYDYTFENMPLPRRSGLSGSFSTPAFPRWPGRLVTQNGESGIEIKEVQAI